MLDAAGQRSTWWMAAGLWTAGACAPLPAGEGATEGTSAGSTAATTGPTTDPPPTSGATEVDPTGAPGCRSDGDCPGDCEYCDDGRCVDWPGCCGYARADDGALERRCSPYYADCYDSDRECGVGEICQQGECVEVPQIPACDRQPLVLSVIPLQDAPAAALLVDLDLDLALDLVVAEPSAGAVEIALGDGAGGFAGGVVAASGLVGDDQRLAAADLDLDGDPDLAVLRAAPAGELSLLFGQDAMFLAPVIYPMGESPRQLFAGPVDGGDAWPDILVIDGLGGDTLTLRVGDGMGGLGLAVVGLHFVAVGAAGAGDIDADGTIELAAPNATAPEVHLLHHDPRGFIAWPSLAGTGYTAHNAALVADLFDPPTASVVATRSVNYVGTISTWSAAGPDGAPPTSEVAIPGGARGVTTGDVDGDGRADLIVLPDEHGPELRVVYAGPGGFACWQAYALAHETAPALVAAGDVDGDGRTDIVVGDPQGASATLLRAGP